MPLSTPEVADAVAITTARTIRPIWAALPCSIPKISFSPKLSWTTPIPSEVAMPKMVPRTAATSIASPQRPSTRLPKIG